MKHAGKHTVWLIGRVEEEVGICDGRHWSSLTSWLSPPCSSLPFALCTVSWPRVRLLNFLFSQCFFKSERTHLMSFWSSDSERAWDIFQTQETSNVVLVHNWAESGPPLRCKPLLKINCFTCLFSASFLLTHRLLHGFLVNYIQQFSSRCFFAEDQIVLVLMSHIIISLKVFYMASFRWFLITYQSNII